MALDEWFYLAMPIIVGILAFSSLSKKAVFILAAIILNYLSNCWANVAHRADRLLSVG